ncbi:orotidine-5'-phosphate decarboxylase [Propionibacteriaceae bacterium Y1700]|uniref:orotidine-5'-phosphate decarboxylase n=1 Tax=Microlunatus sp. Y1700 TaxID=3418487 RepID=UPI003DA702A7
MECFGARLATLTAERGQLCVGIDPHPEMLTAWDLPLDVSGLEKCARTMVEAVAGQVAVVKPQSAFFEAYGAAGIRVLERVLADCREGGTLTLLDAKRGDIGSTMAAYAQAYLAEGAPLSADAITVSPYLGFDSLTPAITLAAQNGRGVFVLARTSNPAGAEVQLAEHDGRPVGQHVVDRVAELNAEAEHGSYGIVYGLTHDALDLDLSRLNGPILVPGLGAQGGQPEHVGRLFGAQAPATLPSTSRDVMSAGPDPVAVAERVRTVAAQVRDGLGAASVAG